MYDLFSVISITLGLISFVTGLILSRKPIFVSPIEKLRIKGVDNHDKSIHFAFIAFSLLVTLPIWLSFSEWALALFPWNLLLYFLLHILVIKLVKQSVSKEFENRRSIRSPHCQNCRKQLKNVTRASNLLTEKEQVASRIGSLTFEVWYCQQCSTEASRDFVHLRAYENGGKFLYCQDCNEITMTRTFLKVITPATDNYNGERFVVYTCQHCNRVEEKTETYSSGDQ